MNSGFTVSNYSGDFIGIHQLVDKAARRLLTTDFPSYSEITHFEGKNGPDGIKSKSPGVDEPWHFYNPFDLDHSELLDAIGMHYDQLVRALRAHDDTKAAFEAAWLAHAITDGLTPAHHYPYEQQLEQVRGGEDRSGRNTIKDKLIMPGESLQDILNNNWKTWGPGGIISAHVMFEYGISIMCMPLSFRRVVINDEYSHKFAEIGYLQWFINSSKHIYTLDMYNTFLKKGWTLKLMRQIRIELMPTIIKAIALTWQSAAEEAK
jgi:hypothetical protein